MPFDWLESRVPAAIRERGPAARRAAHEREVLERASLLRHLGYDQAYAEARCVRNLEWAFEVAGTPPLTAEEVRALVERVYRR